MHSDETSIRTLVEKALHYSQAEQTEVVYQGIESSLTRFANNYIHQNVSESNHELRVRAVVGKRIGVATTNQLDDTSLQQVAEKALEIARTQPENPEFHSLPAPQPLHPASGYSEQTARCSPEERARRVNVIVKLAKEHHLEAAGAFSTGTRHLAVANSLGTFAYEPTTTAECHAVVMADARGSGYAQRVSTDFGSINFEHMARETVEKAERSRNPVDISLGEYPVVLDAYAVADMLQFFAFMGLSAMAVQEERSFMNGQFGKQLADKRVTIYDDGHDLAGLPQAFDYEGVPKQRVLLIEKGIANAVVYDSFTAARAGKPNTGHALPAPNIEGPLPLHTMMEAGDASLEELIKGIDHGLYVTRFHYTNIVHPVKTLFTGMTRDGTFLIEHGELSRPVKNLRFTQSILDVLLNVQGIGRERLQCTDYLTVVAPALSTSRFNFTGVTGT
ncbi:TldD/PmbA family protein [Ktedonosporobacter rubrisoli]|uniref:TldD/PmbA family protein n=1 Tax=Ktedonosporobacter rubrisoli TaxID=2509675 RepID=A0A4P6JW12_KTERU|nr:TldD/PmbA family protein [Ktedonosporobacter rubrisoli]QBD79869.1 TldD/PmbA family protein [Ktedonosporobacter rubrisoli]